MYHVAISFHPVPFLEIAVMTCIIILLHSHSSSFFLVFLLVFNIMINLPSSLLLSIAIKNIIQILPLQSSNNNFTFLIHQHTHFIFKIYPTLNTFNYILTYSTPNYFPRPVKYLNTFFTMIRNQLFSNPPIHPCYPQNLSYTPYF